MITTQGYRYSISKVNILTLVIPKTKGEFSKEVQAAKRELCLDHSIYFKEIKIKKA